MTPRSESDLGRHGCETNGEITSILVGVPELAGDKFDGRELIGGEADLAEPADATRTPARGDGVGCVTEGVTMPKHCRFEPCPHAQQQGSPPA